MKDLEINKLFVMKILTIKTLLGKNVLRFLNWSIEYTWMHESFSHFTKTIRADIFEAGKCLDWMPNQLLAVNECETSANPREMLQLPRTQKCPKKFNCYSQAEFICFTRQHWYASFDLRNCIHILLNFFVKFLFSYSHNFILFP